MCGIAGMIDWRAATPADALRSIGEAMIETVRHRGPDAGEVWVEAEGGVALGPAPARHHRSQSRRRAADAFGRPALSSSPSTAKSTITATSAASCKPPVVPMRSDSDTEVLLEACALWGVEAAIERAIGMFAFALWDRKTRSLLLARDRLGIKPLYYAATPERVLFASAAQGVSRRRPIGSRRSTTDAVVGYLRHAYIAQPRTIYREAAKLAARSHSDAARRLDAGAEVLLGLARHRHRRSAAQRPRARRAGGHRSGSTALLRDSVKLRMIADVPLGAFLSGGIDSSTVVALMQAQSTRPVKTFSIGFHESGYDEAHCAKQVAAHLGTDHTEFYVEPRHALDVIPHLADWFDEPFADPSQIPTYLVSELTRKHVTVALSGDGGDELFAGYNRYLWAERLARAVSSCRARCAAPRPRRCARCAPQTWNRLFAFVPRTLAPGAARRQAAQDRDPARQSTSRTRSTGGS